MRRATRGGVGGREGVWGRWRCTQRVHGGTDWALGTARVRGGAHVKHLAHVREAGRVETQRLVERRRRLPRHTKAHGGRHGGIEAAGERGGRWRCTEGPAGHWGARHTGGHGRREGRTRNMPLIFVTLDVSRCSGWLKADAPCRFTTGLSGQGIPGDRGYQGIVAGGHGGCAGARSVCTEDPDWTLGGTAREGAAHVEHIVHVRDPGRVEGQRLVERRCLLPRVTPRHMRRATQGGGRREGVWGACGGRWRCTQRARRSRLDTGHAHL
jgi:hypothetical protein